MVGIIALFYSLENEFNRILNTFHRPRAPDAGHWPYMLFEAVYLLIQLLHILVVVLLLKLLYEHGLLVRVVRVLLFSVTLKKQGEGDVRFGWVQTDLQ